MRGWGGDRVLVVNLLATKEKDIEDKQEERKDNYPPSGSLNINPPTLLLLLM